MEISITLRADFATEAVTVDAAQSVEPAVRCAHGLTRGKLRISLGDTPVDVELSFEACATFQRHGDLP